MLKFKRFDLLLLAFVIIVFLAVPVAAMADSATVLYDGADFQLVDTIPNDAVQAALPVARAAWPDSPCRGHELVAIAPVPRSYALLSPDGPPLCKVVISDTQMQAYPDQVPWFTCMIMVHEFGHIAGYDHADDPNGNDYDPGNADNIMNGQSWGKFPGCDPLIIPVATPVATPAPQLEIGTAVHVSKPKKKKAQKHLTRKHKG